MPSEKWQFSKRRFILCEGPHDPEFLQCLIKEHQLRSFQVMTTHECVGKGGASGFGPALKNFPKIVGFKRLIGIAIVTDNDNPRTLPNLRRKLERYGYEPLPSGHEGKLDGKPLIIVPLPDASDCGDLEKLCLPALYQRWPEAKECVNAYLECTGAVKWSREQQFHKAEVRCIISGYYDRDPYKGLGYFFRENRHLMRHECFHKLVSALRNFDEIVKAINRKSD